MSDLIHPAAQIDTGAKVGRDVRVGPLAVVGSGAELADGCGVGAAACVGERVVIGRGSTVGDGAVIVAGARIGERARIEPGAVVAGRVPPNAIVQGRMASIIGYVDTPAHAPLVPAPSDAGVTDSVVKGVRLHVMDEVRDMRGDLSAAEWGRDFPFLVRRSFLIYNVPSAEIRGEHAHRRCEQFLIAVRGSLHVMVDDGERREEFRLDRPNLGLYLPPMVWGTQYRYSEDAVLLVLASDPYDPGDYLRDYAEFLALVRGEA